MVTSYARCGAGRRWQATRGELDGASVIWPKADVLTGVTATLVKSVMSGSGVPSIDSIMTPLCSVTRGFGTRLFRASLCRSVSSSSILSEASFIAAPDAIPRGLVNALPFSSNLPGSVSVPHHSHTFPARS